MSLSSSSLEFLNACVSVKNECEIFYLYLPYGLTRRMPWHNSLNFTVSEKLDYRHLRLLYPTGHGVHYLMTLEGR